VRPGLDGGLGGAGRLNGDILAALGQCLPLTAFLFDQQGEILWLSQQARERLGIEGARVQSESRAAPLERVLGELRDAAMAAFGAEQPEMTAIAQPVALLEPDEHLFVRWVPERAGRPGAALVAIVGADSTPGHPAAEPTREDCRRLGLTARESDVALLAARGRTEAQIAGALEIKESTVHTHLKRIYTKLGVASRAELTWTLVLGEDRKGVP